MSHRIRLSLCMIVRDNAAIIETCLTSIRPWVDEMIVVDTGSVDNTPEIARRLGAKVFLFPWCDDFAAARNESIRHAVGEWIFWMDSDDTIDEACGRKLRDLADGSHERSILGYVMRVMCPNGRPGDDGITRVDQVKMFRNLPEIRFDGVIHEQVLAAIRAQGGEIARRIDIFVTHSHNDRTAEGRVRKLERDMRILQKDLELRPGHPFVLFNLGMTYADAGEYDRAVESLIGSLAASHPGDSTVRKAYALLMMSLTQLRRYDDAIRYGRQGLEFCPNDAEIYFRLGLAFQEMGEHGKAIEAYRNALNQPDGEFLASVDCGISSYLARHNLAVTYRDNGQLQMAELQCRIVNDERSNWRPSLRLLGELLIAQQRWFTAEIEAERLLADDRLRSDGRLLQSLLLDGRGKNDMALQQLEVLFREDPTDLGVLHHLARLAFAHAEPAKTEEYLIALAGRAPDGATYFNLGQVQLRLQKLDDAVNSFEESLRRRPNWPATLDLLSHALHCLGRDEEATAAAEAANSCRRATAKTNSAA